MRKFLDAGEGMRCSVTAWSMQRVDDATPVSARVGCMRHVLSTIETGDSVPLSFTCMNVFSLAKFSRAGLG